jgi:hypothetical protein
VVLICPRNFDNVKMTDAIASTAFAIIGLALGAATLAMNPHGIPLTIFVSAALFIMTFASIANYAIQINRRKTLHRIVVTIEAVAAVTVILEVLSSARAGTGFGDTGNLLIQRAFDFVIILAFVLFDLFLGYDVRKHLRSRS